MKILVELYLLTLLVIAFFQIQISSSASIKIVHLKKVIDNLLDSKLSVEKINSANLLIQFLQKYLFSESSAFTTKKPLTHFENGILEDLREKLQRLKLKFNMEQSLSEGYLHKAQHLNIAINQPNWVLSEIIKTEQLKNRGRY